jgi:ketosteroid isomerase-like protein
MTGSMMSGLRLPALLLAACTGGLACSGGTVGQPPAPPVNWQSFARDASDGADAGAAAREIALAQDYSSAMQSPGMALLGHLLDDDAGFVFPGASSARGRDAVVRAHEALFGAFDSRRFVLSRVWRAPGTQTLEWTMTGVQAHDWMSVAATQKPVVIRGLTILSTKRDGTITDVHPYFDVAITQALLGGGPKDLASVTVPSVPAGDPAVFDAGPDPIEPASVVRAALDALEAPSEPLFLGAMADDVEVHTLERAEPARGKDERRAYFKAMHKALAPLDTTVSSAVSVGPFAIVEYTLGGAQIGPIGWVPLQRDRVVKLHVADVAEVRNGKIARIWRYDNPAEMNTPGP